VVVLCVKLFTSSAIPGWATSTLLSLIVVSLVALGNSVLLFALFSQARAIALADVEEASSGSARAASRAAD
jgi:hypothetical protein